MSEILEFARRAVLIGAGATMVMDVWAALLRQFGVPSLNLDFLGRWIGHLARGHWMHVSIAAAAPIRGERWIGWCAHYSIGVAFSALLLWTYGLEWARSPSVLPALFIGIATVIIHHVVGANRTHHVHVPRAAHGRHFGPQGLGDLHGVCSDAARCAVDQYAPCSFYLGLPKTLKRRAAGGR
jgi:hypothetical protein